MHHLYLVKKPSHGGLTQYTYNFNDNPLSPANQMLTRLFRQMVIAVEGSLDELEVEYIDWQMAKNMGGQKALQLLQVLGAKKENIRENKRGEVVISRMFRSPISPEAIEYFKRIQDLEDLAAYRLLAHDQVKIEVFFVKTIDAFLTLEEEETFFGLLEDERIRYKVIE